MRPLVLAAALVCAPVPPAVAASPHALPECAADSLGYRAHTLPPIARSVVLLTVTNRGKQNCTIDRFPTVTFAGLDGSANPAPPVESGPHVINAGRTLYAALRTDDTTAPAHYVPSLAVAASPAHAGRVFTASGIGAPAPGIAVYDPVTTLWRTSADDAVAALPD
ncbi:DUF4232 domain-containing protein [Streptomyces sp. NBC_00344]|uniref:DUF4232 domain-containing protein n=1 Tax=Streptomyces sp. NBC_00344 TaxID=2975720 RepID=UPI002E2387D1